MGPDAGSPAGEKRESNQEKREDLGRRPLGAAIKTGE